MMPAAHIYPFHPGQNIPESVFNRFQGNVQSIGILLTQCMKMKSVQKSCEFFRHFFVPAFPCHPQTAARRTGIIDGMTFLGGALGIDPDPDAFSLGLCLFAVFFQLTGRIKDDMIRIV